MGYTKQLEILEHLYFSRERKIIITYLSHIRLQFGKQLWIAGEEFLMIDILLTQPYSLMKLFNQWWNLPLTLKELRYFENFLEDL